MHPRHTTPWFLLATAALTLGTGLTQVGTHRPGRGVVAVAAAAPVPALAALQVRRPPEQVDEARPHPSATPRPVTPARVVVRRVQPAPAPHRATRRRVLVRTFEQDLRRAVARIPFYRPGVAHWVVWPGLPRYGLTDRVTGTVYLSPRMPRRLLYSVVVHEWAHVISTKGYHGDLRSADAAVVSWYGGGTSARAIELAADCVARVLGATWTHYTACNDSRWRYGARYLMLGWKLPQQ